jgi:hypothetical protein
VKEQTDAYEEAEFDSSAEKAGLVIAYSPKAMSWNGLRMNDKNWAPVELH